MIEQSFIFLDRVSLARERKLWALGVCDWDSFLRADDIRGFGRARKLCFDRVIRHAKELFKKQDVLGLSQLLPPSERWRLYDLCRESILALDIETSGYYGDVTVVGLHDGEDALFLLKNKNLSGELLERALPERLSLLTFNGSSFDLPVLARRFPQLKKRFSHALHIDLRHVAARVGYEGGLKMIEESLGIIRDDLVSGFSGGDAVLSWRLYESCGDESSLERLLEYNKADISNLFFLADELIPRLWRSLRALE